MISKIVGTILKKDTATKIWWGKLAICLVVSNIFFYLLFQGDQAPQTRPSAPLEGVEVQLQAELLTPFEVNKKVLLAKRSLGKVVEGVLMAELGERKINVLTSEEEAAILLQHEDWEVLPYLKKLSFKARTKVVQHEISY